ncbi:MAG TPA: TolC family protein [Thermoanaerobaculia bacterium]|jgi:outer membrane protein TolC|nr:TolC family protein [Thermoanaerobaculia bacterium]
MKHLLSAVFFAAVFAAGAGAATKLSLEQVLARVEAAHDVSPSALAAANLLEGPSRRTPTIRIETSATTAHSVDFIAQNVFGYDAYTSLLSVDYTLIDGGVRDQQLRLSRLDAQSFRQRLQDQADGLFRETLDAVARLYVAQERSRILSAGLQRAVAMHDRAAEMFAQQEISNVTAAQWHDEAIVAETQLLDLELQRLEAETHVRQLMREESGETIEVVIDLDAAPAGRTLGSRNSGLPLERAKLALAEAEAARRMQLTMSAFGGATKLSDVAGDGGYGLFGIRFSLALPMFDGAIARRVAEARLRAEEASLEQRRIEDQIARTNSTLSLNITALEKRIALLGQLVDAARRREESITRLVAAGARAENDVAAATAERARREGDLLGVRVELWKLRQVGK